MLTANQIETMFPDLMDKDMASALALVHQRFSTNTFPSWPLAHPYRYIAHNGEINTLTGNINWMRAREGLLKSSLLGEDLKKMLPVIREGGSDTATFDNVLEFLVMTGRSLPHAILMMIPEPWSSHETMSPELKAFYEYHSSLMEPWDGPASIAFSDGTVIGAVLDRNGLRPSRYVVTKDDLVIMASEVGVLDIPPEDIALKERLHPGRIFLIDTSRGRIVSDEEIKRELATAHPYQEWLSHLIDIEDLDPAPYLPAPSHETVAKRQRLFGYTHEDLRLLLGPMAQQGEEPLGSMGTDTSLAPLSNRPRPLYDYFKQVFAQVTNPPLDAIREELVTSMESTIGPEGNLLDPRPESCRQIKIKYPVIDNDQVAKLRHVYDPGFRAIRIPMLYDRRGGGDALERAMDDLNRRASSAVELGLHHPDPVGSRRRSRPRADSEPAGDLRRPPSPGPQGTRTRCALVVESGDAREVHHCALLLGYGAGAVNPYLAFETLDDMIRQGMLVGITHEKAVINYIKALNKGILKVMSKMGISTLQSYCGAQVFEAVGLDTKFVDKYFTRTASRIGGVGIDVIAEEVRRRHEKAFPFRFAGEPELEWGGEYQWRRDGEYHLFNPETVFKLQHATRSGQYTIFKEYTKLVDDQNQHLATLRGLLEIKNAQAPISIDEVESVESIVKRFATGAMSYGSISKEAHETLAIAMNRLGGKSNTGEGGEDPARYKKDPNGDSRRSAVKQVASARFGVTSEYLVNADDLQIKMAQGAKPGEGGQLPGHKVYPWIAKVRYATPGVGLISPPPHHDIYSIEDLAQLIHDLKNANPEARIHVKLVALAGVGTVAAGVAKAHADVVLISGHDGGTGASPLTSIKHGGVPWELGLAETQQVLMLNKLRDRIVVQVDGQLKTGRDVVVAALMGAEEYGFATAPLVVSGCIMMRVCHLNTCPVGVATQDPELRKKFTGKPEFVDQLLPVHRRGSARVHGGARLPDDGRDDRARRSAELPRRRSITGRRRGSTTRPSSTSPTWRADAPRRRIVAQDHGLDAGARQRADRAVPPMRSSTATPVSLVAADPQRESHRRHDARLPGDEALRRRRTARRHDPAALHRIGRPELRRLRAARHHADARGRLERLHRQGAVGRQDHRLSAGGVHVRRRRQHHHRQRRALRRDERRGLLPRRRRRAVRRPQQRRADGRRRRRRSRLRIHDRRTRRRARTDGPELRGRHERRHRLRARRHGRRSPARCNRQMVDLEPLEQPDDIELVRSLDHAARRSTPAASSARASSRNWDECCPALRQGDAARLQARARGRGARGRSRPRGVVHGARRSRRPMGKATGFIEIARKKHPTRPVGERVHDWQEVYLPYPEEALKDQAARCMDCGIPFCHSGCPLGNLIPDWNDLVYRDRWKAAIDRLHATNNFPEFTGRLCPAPCEGACVLGINNDPVTIKAVEVSIIDRAFDEGWVTAQPA